jgi:hypothetical protein
MNGFDIAAAVILCGAVAFCLVRLVWAWREEFQEKRRADWLAMTYTRWAPPPRFCPVCGHLPARRTAARGTPHPNARRQRPLATATLGGARGTAPATAT